MSTSAKIWRQIKLIRYWCFFSWEIERFCVSSSLILKTEGGQGHRLQNCLPYSLSLLSRRQSIWLVCLHMTSWRPYLCPKTMNGGHVCVPNQSCGGWTLFLCKRFLLFQLICIDAGHVSENTLYLAKWRLEQLGTAKNMRHDCESQWSLLESEKRQKN